MEDEMRAKVTAETFEKYAKDLGEVVQGVLEVDYSAHLLWTENTWEDGVPVTKCFERSDEIPVFIPKGTTLTAVQYYGRATGCPMLDFYFNKVWYSARNSDAMELAELLNVDPY
jgi:hypothetical protein